MAENKNPADNARKVRQANRQTNEIDLIDLFRKTIQAIGNFFLFIFRSILFMVIFGVRKIHFLLLFVIAGGIIGQVMYKNTKRYFSSYMIAQANGIKSADMINYINDLHDLCVQRNTPALAFNLQMPDSTANKIKDIQAFFIIDVNHDEIGDFVDFKNDFDLTDTTIHRLEDRLHVKVEVYDNSIFRNVKNGLFRYMRKNPYLISLNEIRKMQLQELIAQATHEIKKLDSLQNTDYFQKNRQVPVQQSQLMFLAEKEPTMYYRDKMNLMNRKLEYTKELELATDAFTVIKDFTSLAFEENPRGKYLMRYSFMFAVFGYVFLLLFRFRKTIRKYSLFD